MRERLQLLDNKNKTYEVVFTFEEVMKMLGNKEKQNEFNQEVSVLARELVKEKKINYTNHLISTLIYKGEKFYFNCYGGLNVYLLSGESLVQEASSLEEIEKQLNLAVENLKECSDPTCQYTFPIGREAGKYFAGVYCETCWENKWKSIEANENYN